MDFSLDGSGSSANVLSVSGSFCSILATCFDVGIAPGFGGSSNFSLAEGASRTFDFIRFAFNGDLNGSYRLSATLAFTQPVATSVTDTGGGQFMAVSGVFTGGSLTWDQTSPTVVTMGDGSSFSVAFNNFAYGQGAILNGPVMGTATVTALSVAPVPLPATGLLLVGGLGAIALVRRKASRKTA
ncbi:VPLPA-CTERM sorting domain-containing protein [Roseibacterium sp. SDUM158016]|uniref:VPLPA-CTERM sorting domain-containing protein n=1 Tax=Roseicyclus sediminis TaxID=2980997 RepID=UPI0021D1276C|nr:VPLPA-CTERM sorting domain-containing protein [Roseibacterium sp. SDUM158016]MCU4653690.1 VPLPA-CTERM sorting domain-containing protein [Roseibacterium sp. SDUM158016]